MQCKTNDMLKYLFIAGGVLSVSACGGGGEGGGGSSSGSTVNPLELDCGGSLSLTHPGSNTATSCSLELNGNLVSEADYEVNYQAGSSSVISVSDTGVVTPLSVGSTTLKYSVSYTEPSTNESYSDSQTVSVSVAEGDSTLRVSCIPETIIVDYRGGEYLPVCTGQLWNAASQSYENLEPTSEQRDAGIFAMSFSTTDTNIAVVSEEGIVQSINDGSTELTVAFSYDENENGTIDSGESISASIPITSKAFTDNVELISSEKSIWLGIDGTKRIDITAVDVNGNLTNVDCTVEPHFTDGVSVEQDTAVSTDDIIVFNMTGISKDFDEYGYFGCQETGGLRSQVVSVQVKDPVDIPNPTGISQMGDKPDIISSQTGNVYITSYSSTERSLVLTTIAGTVSSETLSVLNSQESGIQSGLLLDPVTQTPSILTISSKNFVSTLDQISFGTFGTHRSTEIDADLGYYNGSTVLDLATNIDGSYQAAVASTTTGLNLYQKEAGETGFTSLGEVLPGTITDVALDVTTAQCGTQPVIAACTAEHGLVAGIWSDNELSFYQVATSCDLLDMQVGMDNRMSIVANQGEAFTSGEELKYYVIESGVGQMTVDSLETGASYKSIDMELDYSSMPRVAAVVAPSFYAVSNEVYHYSLKPSYSMRTSFPTWVRDEIDTGFEVGDDLGLTIDRRNASGLVIEGNSGIIKYISQPSFISYSNNTASLGRLACSAMNMGSTSPVHTFTLPTEE